MVYEVEQVCCNLCGRDDARTRFVVGAYRIVECQGCGLNYVNPRLPPQALEDVYQNNYFKNQHFFDKAVNRFYGYSDYFGDRTNIEEVYGRILDHINGLTPRGRLLEIGSAYGFFLAIAKRSGWTVTGIEPSADAAAFARQTLDIDTFNGCCSDFSAQGQVYDVAVMFDVIEHLHDPARELSRINGLLKSGGLMVVSTPNIGSVLVKILGAKWEDLQRAGSNEHLYFFSPSTLSKMLERCGFELIRISYVKRQFTLGQLIQRLERLGVPRGVLQAVLTLTRVLRVHDIGCYVGMDLKLIAYAKKVRPVAGDRSLA